MGGGADAGPAADAALIEVAARLSTVPPDEFVRARATAAAEAGDKALAAAIRRLRKPVLAAWVVNVAAAERTDALADALGLAEEFRDALDSGDAKGLSALNARRRELVRTLAVEAVGLADARGVDVGPAVRDGVERTFDAALRDPDAAAAVASARLLRPIEASGMEPPDLDGAVSGPFDATSEAGGQETRGRTDELAERRARRDAERAARDARRRAEHAEHDLARAEERARAAQERVEALEERLEALTAERERVIADLDGARETLEPLHAAVAEARAEARSARRAAERATPGE